MLKSRAETAVALVVLVIGLVIAGILGLWGYMSATATPLHPKAEDVRSVASGTPAPEWAETVAQSRQIVRTALSTQNLPGLSAAVGVNGNLVWAEGFGWADLEQHLPVTPKTRFRIGTASTVLTSAAVGVLLEKGRLALDEPIQTYVSKYPRKQWPVTLRQLMGHTAGLGNDGGDEGPLLGAHCERPVEALRVFGEDSLRFQPGTDYRYSSYGWILASAAVESAAGEPFLRVMRKEVFEPLGMHDTRADNATTDDGSVEAERANPDQADVAPIPNRATSYFPRFAADPRYGHDLMRPVDYSCYAGASAFLSTPSDLVRFGMGINGSMLLKPETVRLLQTPERLASGREPGYGLGWDVESATLAGAKARWVGHEGTALGGMVASLITFPDSGLVIAVTSNTSYADTETMAVNIAQAFAQQSKKSARP